ncbi:cupin domain-containing protein [Pollutimonas thiosulfatoxidans]|uniref:Cupin n=1 Tax=Pollutimonas thiosulfatoxidans TaxID=2028345 RepID=A0A410GD36_9BURK|nr:cupin domain-containing protein [Pollutimonas thiosulfatoxidans]QAA94222.1 cupin [Pollutimonas thiosulfatoxidans]
MTEQSHVDPINWMDLVRENVREGVERSGFQGDNAICVWNWIEPGNEVNPHSHTFEQLVLILEGTANYHVGDKVYRCRPGSVLRVPSHTEHYIEVVGNETVLNLDIFAPVRDDYTHLTEYQTTSRDSA